MKLSIALLLAASSFAWAEPSLGIYAITRTILIERCESESKCGGAPVLEDKRREEITIKGDCGSIERKTLMGNTPFKIEIAACHGPKGISTYAMLRSGPGIKRHGVIKQHTSNNNILVDKPIAIDGRLYRAKLILEPEGLLPAG